MGINKTMKALSDPTRRTILNYLKDGSMTAGEISSQFDMAPATISHHLSILKKADLINEQRHKNYIYYSINTSVLEEVLLWISSLKGDEKNVL